MVLHNQQAVITFNVIFSNFAKAAGVFDILIQGKYPYDSADKDVNKNASFPLGTTGVGGGHHARSHDWIITI